MRTASVSQTKRLFTHFLAIAVVALQLACHHAQVVPQAPPSAPPPSNSPDLVLQPSSPKFKFIAYGDIRFTHNITHPSNPEARRAIIDAVAKEKPALVVITGDIPFRGADNNDWRVYDAESKPLRDAKIPILPAFGNHEFYNALGRRNRAEGLANFYKRFPKIPNRPDATWYSARYANTYFLVLNNADEVSPAQIDWLKAQLQSIPNNVDFVFVAAHRPSYTAATDSGHRPREAEMEVAHILEQAQQSRPKPQIVMFAGHVHNYEHYRHGGVEYITTGGGGATPYKLNRPAEDLFHPQDPAEVEYHYCVVTVDHDKLKLDMRRLDFPIVGKPKFTVRDTINLPVLKTP